MSTAGRFVEKKILHKKLYNTWPHPESTTVKVYIHHIKQKLGKFSDLIRCNRDLGYQFNIEYANNPDHKTPNHKNCIVGPPSG